MHHAEGQRCRGTTVYDSAPCHGRTINHALLDDNSTRLRPAPYNSFRAARRHAGCAVMNVESSTDAHEKQKNATEIPLFRYYPAKFTLTTRN